MTDEAITIMAKAMETKRAELIERPIARIYPGLAKAALEALRAAGYWVERWRPIEEAPTLERLIVAGWQKPSGTTVGYWWLHEDTTDGMGVPSDHPDAMLWQPMPSVKRLPPPPVQSEGGDG